MKRLDFDEVGDFAAFEEAYGTWQSERGKEGLSGYWSMALLDACRAYYDKRRAGEKRGR